MTVAASRVERVLGILMLAAAIGYLLPFVPRGWVPHDEGMLGQAADRVLNGAIPHLDYEEPYTGGLSYVYAAVFRIAGVDLLHIRWLLLVVAACAVWLVYALARRSLRPVGAALAAWLALAWSFPNYFAGLPSWWLLLCALSCLWGLARYSETGRWWPLLVAGSAAGAALAIKQTGAYLAVALALTLLYDGGRDSTASPRPFLQAARWAFLGATAVLASAILVTRVFQAEGLYLWVPAMACAIVPVLPAGRSSQPASRSPLAAVSIAAAAGAVPMIVLLVPYVIHGGVGDFVYGALILPGKRLTYASAPMPSVWWLVAGLPPFVLVVRPWRGPTRPAMLAALSAGAIAMALLALRNAVAYRIVWQSARAYAALLPIAICWHVATRREPGPERRCILFGSAAILAWMSLNQFPFAAPIYFSYVAPLAVVATVLLLGGASSRPAGRLAPWVLLLLLFAVLSTNRAYIESLGMFHAPRRFDAELRLPRAHLRLGQDDVDMFREMFVLVDSHLDQGPLIAAPDCPEVYFLLDVPNPSRTLFDFFSADGADVNDLAAWSRGDVIVVNHDPRFSPAPSDRLSAALRREFPKGKQIGRFEVRWR